MDYSEPMTVGRLKRELESVSDDVFVNVLNEDGDSTANIEIWIENLQSRKFVELIGHEPYHKMKKRERKELQMEDCPICGEDMPITLKSIKVKDGDGNIKSVGAKIESCLKCWYTDVSQRQ